MVSTSSRPVALSPCVGRDDVETIYLDVSSPYLVAREDLNAAGRRHTAQFDLPQVRHRSIVEDRTLLRGGVEANILDPVIRRKLKTIRLSSKSDPSPVAFTVQRLSGRKTDRRCVGKVTTDGNSADT